MLDGDGGRLMLLEMSWKVVKDEQWRMGFCSAKISSWMLEQFMAYASQSKTVNQDPTGQKSLQYVLIHFDRDTANCKQGNHLQANPESFPVLMDKPCHAIQ